MNYQKSLLINTLISRRSWYALCTQLYSCVCLCKWSAELLQVLIAFTVPHVCIEYSSKTFLKTLHVLQLKLCSCSNETVIVCVTDIFTIENILATLNNGEWSSMSSLETILDGQINHISYVTVRTKGTKQFQRKH